MQRNSFGIHTDINGVYMPLLRRSSLVKVLFQPSEAGTVKAWKAEANPNTYWLARTNIDQDVGVPGELQNRYRAAVSLDEVRGVGKWYAEWIASWALPAGLDYFFWESGPNEEDDMSSKAPEYTLAFVQRCYELGLKGVGGMYSFGKPGVIKYDGYDGWAPWQPVFRYIESLNAGKASPVAGFSYHEYALGRSMVGSIDFAIERYKLTGYQGPAFISELGYAYGDKPPSTEEVLAQLMTMNARYGADDRMCGTALYDIRRNAGPFNWDYMYADIERELILQNLPILPITGFGGGTPPPPPPPPPVEGVFRSAVLYTCNQRAEPTINSTLLGKIAGTTPPATLDMVYPAVNGYLKAYGQPFWLYAPNIKKL